MSRLDSPCLLVAAFSPVKRSFNLYIVVNATLNMISVVKLDCKSQKIATAGLRSG